jgi:hypothetical protein
MDPLPALDVPTWPAPNSDKTTTLSPETVAKVLVLIGTLRGYLESQYEQCKIPGDGE